MNFLLDPRIFNFVIMGLYGLNIGRWALAGNWWSAGYWGSALALVVIITFGRTH